MAVTTPSQADQPQLLHKQSKIMPTLTTFSSSSSSESCLGNSLCFPYRLFQLWLHDFFCFLFHWDSVLCPCPWGQRFFDVENTKNLLGAVAFSLLNATRRQKPYLFQTDGHSFSKSWIASHTLCCSNELLTLYLDFFGICRCWKTYPARTWCCGCWTLYCLPLLLPPDRVVLYQFGKRGRHENLLNSRNEGYHWIRCRLYPFLPTFWAMCTLLYSPVYEIHSLEHISYDFDSVR